MISSSKIFSIVYDGKLLLPSQVITGSLTKNLNPSDLFFGGSDLLLPESLNSFTLLKYEHERIKYNLTLRLCKIYEKNPKLKDQVKLFADRVMNYSHNTVLEVTVDSLKSFHVQHNFISSSLYINRYDLTMEVNEKSGEFTWKKEYIYAGTSSSTDRAYISSSNGPSDEVLYALTMECKNIDELIKGLHQQGVMKNSSIQDLRRLFCTVLHNGDAEYNKFEEIVLQDFFMVFCEIYSHLGKSYEEIVEAYTKYVAYPLIENRNTVMA